jgi:predicted metal-dependent peptidase
VTKYFCLDVSGSMCSDDIRRALSIIADHAKPTDFLLLFDCEVQGIWPVDQAMKLSKTDPETAVERLCTGVNKGRGGTDANPVFVEIEKREGKLSNVHTVLLSDGFMGEGQVDTFDEFVNVHPAQDAS